MPADGARLLAAYKQQDKALVRAGWHATSLPWMTALERFWLSSKTRMTVRKGRQSGFSTTMARVAVCTGLYGAHRVAPGTRLAIPFVSIKMSEARERLYNIGQILEVLGVRTRQSSDVIEVDDADHPAVVWLTLACNFRTAVGLTAAAAFEDEMSRWVNDDGSANPAPEVDAAITPMGITQPNFRVYGGSSPLGHEDFHAELFARGDTDDQAVFEGPTWFWNPTITEAATRRLQPDDRIWRREYAAIPQAGKLSAFSVEAVDRAFAHPRHKGQQGPRVLLLDPSSGRKDAFTFAIAGWVSPPPGREGQPSPDWPAYLHVEVVSGFEGKFWDHTSGETIVEKLAALAKTWNVRSVHADQRESMMLRAAFNRRGLAYHVHDWTAASKPEAVERVRRWFAESAIALPEHETLRRELLAFEERVTPSGALTFSARGSGHDDYVALLVTAAMAEIGGELTARSGPPMFGIGAAATSPATQLLVEQGRHVRNGGRWW